MSDLIKRSDAIKAIEELPNAYNGWSDTYDKAYIIGALEEVPSADIPHSDDWEKYSDKLWKIAYERGKADRPQGEWIAKTENYHSHWVCSECGAWALLEYNEQMCLSNFCPHCGARMKGADDEL